ncbi:hybrid sensor histidine kinase/response regulator [bacterium]|nr:hybrid sensor histidine kinase/response regulator [bacterium]
MAKTSKPLVLIVDDVPKNLQVLGSHLKQENMEIAVATNGNQALSAAQKTMPDLILLDVMMPEMDGFETCKRLKANPKTAEIPIIFLTARTETDDIIHGLKLGAVDYVTKPFHGTELLARVKTHLDLKLSREALKEANATKDRFFSIIAHDLRAPFSTLIGFSEFLIEDYTKMEDAVKRDIINDILSVSRQSYQLFENLLAWARSQTGSLEFHPEKIELRRLIEENISFMQKTAKEKEIALSSQVPENLWVLIDRNMILTVIRNLISNAVKFTPRKGCITLSAESIDHKCQVSVADTGVGIPDEIQNQLFKVGNHISTIGTENEEGSGLGLILCYEFIKRNQGHIRIESEPGKGSRFLFTLPLAKNTE